MIKVGYIYPFHSQKVLPLVYDDSLSYYEAINKLKFKINEVIGFINDNIEAMVATVIQNYFVKVAYDAENTCIDFTLLEKEDS